MMEAIEKSRITEINTLHGEIKESFYKALRVGELLTQQRAAIPHGEWLPWVKANLVFSDRTASNYMRLYQNKALLKSESVSDLTDAYKLLQEPKTLPTDDSNVVDVLVSEIEFNPYFDIAKLKPTRVARVLEQLTNREYGQIIWTIVRAFPSGDHKDIGINDSLISNTIDSMVKQSPEKAVYWLTPVRHHNGRYENLTDHYRLAAIKAAGIKRIRCVLVDLTDEQMKYTASLEPTDPVSTYGEFCRRLKADDV